MNPSGAHRSKPTTNQHYQETLTRLQSLIAEFIMDDEENIQPQLDIEDGLGIDLEVSFPKLVAKINHVFGIQLNADLLVEDLEIIKVADLATIISDETELG